MKFGVHLPNIRECGDPRVLADLAHEAEESGWDGVFIWDSIYVADREGPICDPWIALTAAAMRTERVRLGTFITPLSRRRPWKVARETVTLDHLSNGRFILPVGLGSTNDGGFSRVGEELDRKRRAERLDEALDIITGLWRGEPFQYAGKHYQIDEMTFLPKPVQTPRIPIWVVGVWQKQKSMQRAMRYDGILPEGRDAAGEYYDMPPADVKKMKAEIDGQRTQTTPFDIVIQGYTPGDDSGKAAAIINPWIDAGATWFLEHIWDYSGGLEGKRKRIHQGPPRFD